MTYVLVKQRCSELQVYIRLPNKIQPYLTEPKQIEVVDQERTDQNDSETQQTNRLNNNAGCFGLHLPDDATQRLPVIKEQEKTQACRQYIRASFDGFGYKLRPPFFECRPR